MTDKEHLIQAMLHYQMLRDHLRQASPGFSISGWQEMFLNAFADLARKIDDRAKRDAEELQRLEEESKRHDKDA